MPARPGRAAPQSPRRRAPEAGEALPRAAAGLEPGAHMTKDEHVKRKRERAARLDKMRCAAAAAACRSARSGEGVPAVRPVRAGLRAVSGSTTRWERLHRSMYTAIISSGAEGLRWGPSPQGGGGDAVA